ncbi:hypothetical protein LTR66_000613 [Elasticomyces elasticus]|nr:hypothetical protein LTR66_000613 [Elasticomyces elasticus]
MSGGPVYTKTPAHTEEDEEVLAGESARLATPVETTRSRDGRNTATRDVVISSVGGRMGEQDAAFRSPAKRRKLAVKQPTTRPLREKKLSSRTTRSKAGHKLQESLHAQDKQEGTTLSLPGGRLRPQTTEVEEDWHESLHELQTPSPPYEGSRARGSRRSEKRVHETSTDQAVQATETENYGIGFQGSVASGEYRKPIRSEPEASPSTFVQTQEPIESQELFGQMSTLTKVFEAINTVGVSHRNGETLRHSFAIQTAQVKELRNTCKRAEAAYTSLAGRDLASTNNSDKSTEDAAKDLLVTVEDQALTLCSDDYDWASEDLVCDIYAHAFPHLTRVLQRLVTYYLNVLSNEEDESCGYSCLRPLLEFVRVILKLGEAVKNFTAKPDSTSAIVKPVRNRIIAPLRRVQKVWSEGIEREDWKRHHLVLVRTWEEDLQRDSERERHEEREARLKRQKAKLWRGLLLARLSCEPDVRRWRHLRTNHLQQVLMSDNSDLDANGRPFERLPMFTPRSSLIPGQPASSASFTYGNGGKLMSIELQETAELALIKALERYAETYSDPVMLFEKIFKEHCCRDKQWHRDGALRPFNALQIAARAGEMKRNWIEDDVAQGREVEAWIRCIPEIL